LLCGKERAAPKLNFGLTSGHQLRRARHAPGQSPR
jgi:hypothetical protein